LSTPSYVAGAPAEEAEVAAAPTRRRRLPRVPKAVLVTALTFALSAWLLPAMTRQWDDRQKEHELKANVVADMGKDTAHALIGGEAIWSGQKVSIPEQKRLGTEWSLAALEMESRLRTYFSPSVVRSWELYAWAADRFINARTVSASAELHDAVASGRPLDRGVEDATAELMVLSASAVGNAPSFGSDGGGHTQNSDTESIATLEKMLSPHLERDKADAPDFVAWTLLEKQVLALEQAVADQVLHSHAEGFSTSAKDLLHDLMP